MVTASVDNSPISIVLGSNESTTVPTGEVWKITVTFAGGSGDGILINTDEVLAYRDASTHPNPEIVLTAGDTIETTGNSSGAHLGGYVIRTDL